MHAPQSTLRTVAALKLRRIGIDTYRENVAYLPRNCILYRPEELQALVKIEVTSGSSRILASLNVVEDERLLSRDELGLSDQAYRLFGRSEGSPVDIRQAPPPASLDAVRAKIRGRTLSRDEIQSVIQDIAANRYSRTEIAAFLIACSGFLTTEETLNLTRSMAAAGTRLAWADPLVVDKHCIGGIPGNRTSMIVVPIVAAHGLTIPKTSSRAITSPAGTADTMEVLANVDLDVARMRNVVEQARGCLVWGGHVNLSPADDLLIAVERPLGVDTPEQMVASILSKKLAAGSTHLLIDIPTGPTAKVRSLREAVRLRKLFEHIAGEIGLFVEVILTEALEPIGLGIGPVLEARDVMSVLRCDPTAPRDLQSKALLLAGRMLEFDPSLRGGQGLARARELLESGAALRAMERIVQAQGSSKVPPALGPLSREIVAGSDGIVRAIDCLRVARIARLAGAPLDKGAGIDLLRKVGDRVRKGDPLYRIHSVVASDFKFATEYATSSDGVTIQ